MSILVLKILAVLVFVARLIFDIALVKRLRAHKKYHKLIDRLLNDTGVVNTELIYELYNLVNSKKILNDFYPEARIIVNDYLYDCISKCSSYEEILICSRAIVMLDANDVHDPSQYVYDERERELLAQIERHIKKGFATANPLGALERLRQIKEDIKDFAWCDISDLENRLNSEYLKKLAVMFGFLEIDLDTAIKTAEICSHVSYDKHKDVLVKIAMHLGGFCSELSRNEHPEAITKIQNFVTPILKDNLS